MVHNTTCNDFTITLQLFFSFIVYTYCVQHDILKYTIVNILNVRDRPTNLKIFFQNANSALTESTAGYAGLLSTLYDLVPFLALLGMFCHFFLCASICFYLCR